MFLFRRRKKPLGRKALLRYKVRLAIYIVIWLTLLYLVFYGLSLTFLVRLILGVFVMAFAPPIPYLFHSREKYEAELEEMKRFFPDDPKDSEE